MLTNQNGNGIPLLGTGLTIISLGCYKDISRLYNHFSDFTIIFPEFILLSILDNSSYWKDNKYSICGLFLNEEATTIISLESHNNSINLVNLKDSVHAPPPFSIRVGGWWRWWWWWLSEVGAAWGYEVAAAWGGTESS